MQYTDELGQIKYGDLVHHAVDGDVDVNIFTQNFYRNSFNVYTKT